MVWQHELRCVQINLVIFLDVVTSDFTSLFSRFGKYKRKSKAEIVGGRTIRDVGFIYCRAASEQFYEYTVHWSDKTLKHRSWFARLSRLCQFANAIGTPKWTFAWKQMNMFFICFIEFLNHWLGMPSNLLLMIMNRPQTWLFFLRTYHFSRSWTSRLR